MDSCTDVALMVAVAKGDQVAYRALVARHMHALVRMGERMLGSRQDAEDVVQDVCLKIWHEAPRWRPEAKFTTWLYRVMMNACIDVLRKRVPQGDVDMTVLLDDAPLANELIAKQQQAQQVKQALQQLPERQRAAVILSYYEACDNQTSADVMGLSLGAFQQLLFRAKKQLRDELTLQEKELLYG